MHQEEMSLAPPFVSSFVRSFLNSWAIFTQACMASFFCLAHFLFAMGERPKATGKSAVHVLWCDNKCGEKWLVLLREELLLLRSTVDEIVLCARKWYSLIVFRKKENPHCIHGREKAGGERKIGCQHIYWTCFAVRQHNVSYKDWMKNWSKSKIDLITIYVRNFAYKFLLFCTLNLVSF